MLILEYSCELYYYYHGELANIENDHDYDKKITNSASVYQTFFVLCRTYRYHGYLEAFCILFRVLLLEICRVCRYVINVIYMKNL